MDLKDKYIIPIKVGSYEDIFNEYDYRSLDNRKVNEDIDSFILDTFKNIKKSEALDIILEINLPKSEYSEVSEQLSIKAIENYYNSKIKFDEKISKFAVKQIIYYIIISLIFSILWFYTQKSIGDTFLTMSFNTASTVILWQVMSLIFIESKNYNMTRKVNTILGSIKIIFKYLD